jgi:hypothetical protein
MMFNRCSPRATSSQWICLRKRTTPTFCVNNSIMIKNWKFGEQKSILIPQPPIDFYPNYHSIDKKKTTSIKLQLEPTIYQVSCLSRCVVVLLVDLPGTRLLNVVESPPYISSIKRKQHGRNSCWSYPYEDIISTTTLCCRTPGPTKPPMIIRPDEEHPQPVSGAARYEPGGHCVQHVMINRSETVP